jgi:hypothetical protein
MEKWWSQKQEVKIGFASYKYGAEKQRGNNYDPRQSRKQGFHD